MTLTEYFADKPRGSKTKMAKELNLSKTWLSLVINNRVRPSIEVTFAICKYTKGKVSRKVLRPDVFGV